MDKTLSAKTLQKNTEAEKLEAELVAGSRSLGKHRFRIRMGVHKTPFSTPTVGKRCLRPLSRSRSPLRLHARCHSLTDTTPVAPIVTARASLATRLPANAVLCRFLAIVPRWHDYR
jgi:hypothetical protein